MRGVTNAKIFLAQRRKGAKEDAKKEHHLCAYFAPLRLCASYLFSASTNTRPVTLLGGVMRNSADNVGAMSAGVAASKYRPGLIPAPIMIVGTCVSYEYGEPCVAVSVSARYL